MSMNEGLPRRKGTPGSRSVAIADRYTRAAFAMRCSRKYEKIIEFYEARFEDTSLKWEQRAEAANWLIMRGFGRVIQPIEARLDVESSNTERRHVIHEVRWLPPDPADNSKVIEAEPD